MIVAKVNIFATEAKTVYKMNLPEGLHGGEIRLKFRDPVWDGLIKLYVFNDHLETSTRVLPSGDVEIPAEELIENQHLRFGVYGIDAQGTTIIPTIWADLGIVQSAADPGQDPGLDPDLPVWMQILQRIGDLKQLATLCKSSLVCAINEIKHTAEDAKNTAEEVRRQAASGQFDGFSPMASVEDATDGVKLTVTDRYGTTEKIIKNGKDGKEQDISGKQNWATVKLKEFPEAETADTLHAWVNANHKGPDRKWLVESSNPNWDTLAASLGGLPSGVSERDSAFIILEIPYSEAGPETLQARYILRNTVGVWDMTQYTTYSTPTPTWHSTGWIKEVVRVTTAVIATEVDHLVCDMTASQIINASRQGVVKAEYTDDASGETREYYYFKQLPDGRACFTKDGYIEEGVPKQTLFYVDYAGNVEVETREPSAVTCYATCAAEAAPPSTSPVTWYVPKTMPRPSGNPGMMIDVFWKNGRADGLGYDVSLVYGSEGGADNETIITASSTTDSLTGEHSIPTEGTVRYQLEEVNGRNHWRYVSGDLLAPQFSSATAAETADKAVPGMSMAYLPGMDIYLQLDKGNTADLMRLVPADGPTLPVYGNGVGATTGSIPAGYILHLVNAADHWQAINSAKEVPEWAMKPQKPVYTAKEVGALPDSTKIPSRPSDIGAQPAGDYALRSEIPTKTSGLENDSGFITKEEIPKVLDDSVISPDTGWSSLKIADEIIHQGTKAERWEDIQRIVRSGMAKQLLRPGDIFNATWTDPASKKIHEVPWHIADIRNVEKPNGETVEAAIIQLHRVLPNQVPFDQYEAFYVVKDKPLEPGTYHIVMAEKWGDHHLAGDAWSFDLSKPVPVGGLLAGFHNTPYSGFDNAKVESYATQTDDTPLESVKPRKAAEGTKLGDLTFKGGNGCNSVERVCYGYNNYMMSYQRQWLNAAGTGWWTPQNEYDLPPADYKNRVGFLEGWDPSFLSVLQPFKQVTIRNRDTDSGEADVTYDKLVLPSLEEMYIKKQVEGEGPVLPYWKDVIALPEPREWYKDTPELVHLDINGTRRAVRLRSALVGNGDSVWLVNTGGYVYNNNAYNAYAAAPLAAIY